MKKEEPVAQVDKESELASKKGKKKTKSEILEENDEEQPEDEPAEGGTVKTAAQKKKEKKEREKQKKIAAKMKKDGSVEDSKPDGEVAEVSEPKPVSFIIKYCTYILIFCARFHEHFYFIFVAS